MSIKRSALFFSAIVFACLLVATSSFAEDTLVVPSAKPALELPREIPPLPGPAEAENKLLVSRANVGTFHELLLAPLASWLKEGKLVIRVVRELNYQWSLGNVWDNNTKENFGKFDIDDQFRLIAKETPSSYALYPFGFAEDINQDPDPVRRAYKILWNGVYAQGAALNAAYELKLTWYGASSVAREAAGKFIYRVHLSPHEEAEPLAAAPVPAEGVEAPTELPPADTKVLEFSGADDLLSQSVLRLFYPSAVAGFAQVHWRYRGTGEDLNWTYSPVIEKSRKIFEANRSDTILEGALAPDDIFVWSARVADTKARVVGEKVLLLPSASLYEVSAKAESYPEHDLDRLASGQLPPAAGQAGDGTAIVARGPLRNAEGNPVSMSWNYQTRQYIDAAPWMPSGAVFIPRKVWILEISSENPYYLYGRQILIVDQESMLPFYKLVYTQQGKYQKSVVGSWSIAKTEDGKVSFPVNNFLLSVDADFKKASSVNSTAVWNFTTDAAMPAELSKWLNIEKHGQKVKEEPTQVTSTLPPAAAPIPEVPIPESLPPEPPAVAPMD